MDIRQPLPPVHGTKKSPRPRTPEDLNGLRFRWTEATRWPREQARRCAAGLAPGTPILMTGDRVLFIARTAERSNVWEVRLSPGSWRCTGLRTNSRLEQ
jgi:hypothetical protein